MKYCYYRVYGAWIKRAFRSVGCNFYVVPPFYLLGGENIIIGDNCQISKGCE
ncbi:MAG: hypothetical protein R3Y59_05150 [bacterium]